MATSVRLSPRHFTRAFSIRTGMSPHAFVMQQRVERARELLLTLDMEIVEVALACGLSDHAHLSRLFKRFSGTTPSQWRESSLESNLSLVRPMQRPVRAKGPDCRNRLPQSA
ncbi:helix-turn-helix domain-containing protein [Pararhizobium qamdonense]|uniref:helix-turn-helix domain-containing protein n=1 Tax=Pararhizobium qamdonense TaxID=3031126 RepID=UPI0038B2993E